MKSSRRSGLLILLVSLTHSYATWASGWGPVFPTHDFPTDRSFMFNTHINYGTQGAIFDETGAKTALEATQSRFRLSLNPEYQPNRDLSIGAILNVDSLKLTSDTTTLSKAGLADQYIFGEYRFYDQPGISFGFGGVFKIPAYSVPKEVDSGTAPFLILGDGSLDGTLFLTSEFWPYTNMKVFADLGFTYRADDFASEIPYKVGVAYVSPTLNVGLDFLGNFSMGNDKASDDATTLQIQQLTGGTNYVFAKNPALFMIELKAEYAFSYQWAIGASFENSLSGKNAPYFFNLGAGISYRFFDPQYATRTAREVDLGTDDTADEFEGELQESSGAPSSRAGRPVADPDAE